MAQYSKIANGTWREAADIIPRAEFDASVGAREDRDAFAARGRSNSNCNPIGPGRPEGVPSSMAIAGIHGYMGQLIYKAALEVGVPRIYGFDPGPRPADFRCTDRLRMLAGEEEFYELNADLFHIATHPKLRHGVYRLLDRGRHVNVEKPMAHPAHPGECSRLRAAAAVSSGTVLFDFVDVFNPRTYQFAPSSRNSKSTPISASLASTASDPKIGRTPGTCETARSWSRSSTTRRRTAWHCCFLSWTDPPRSREHSPTV